MGKVTQSVEGSFEAQAAKLRSMEEGGALHEGADEVVGNNVEQEFFLDHRGCQATFDGTRLSLPPFGAFFATAL